MQLAVQRFEGRSWDEVLCVYVVTWRSAA